MNTYQLSTDVKPGDVIGFSGWTSLDRWICYVTLSWPGSGISHMGICTRSPLPNDDGLAVFESTTTLKRPCMYAGQVVHGAQFQPLGERVYEAQEAGSVWLLRLRKPLTEEESQRLTALCIADSGKPYDYVGAIRSRKAMLGWLFRLIRPRPKDLKQLFCSETVASRLEDLERWSPGNASDWNPEDAERALVREGATDKRVRLFSTLITGA